MEAGGWNSSAALVWPVSTDSQTFVQGTGSLRMSSAGSALNATATFDQNPPLNLDPFEELRFWVRSSRSSSGSPNQPFYLEFSYIDDNDAANEMHSWFVPVNRSNMWEQRRIGIENERRSAVSSFSFRCLTTDSFVCHIDEILAVREEMLPDLESALVVVIENQLTLPGAFAIPLSQTAVPNAAQIVIPLNRLFNVNNQVIIRGGTAGDELHTVTGITHNQAGNSTTLVFGAQNQVVGTLNAGVANVSIRVPVFVEAPPLPNTSNTPAIILTLIDSREDSERSGYVTQRDSFRQRGNLTVCQVRPSARAYNLIYQIIAIAPTRNQQIHLQNSILQRFSMDLPLRINGFPSPVWIMPPPVWVLPPPGPTESLLGTPSPVIVRIGTRMETAARTESPWVREARIESARIDAPLDTEGIVIQL